MERHERAVRVQRPGDHDAEGLDSPRERGAPGGAQRVRDVLSRGDGGWNRKEKRRRTAVRAVARLLRGDATRRADMDRRQRRGLEPLAGVAAHGAHPGRDRSRLLRRRRRRFLRQPRRGAHDAVVPDRDLLPVLPRARASGHETSRAVAVRGAVHRADSRGDSPAVPAHAVSVHVVRRGAPRWRSRDATAVVRVSERSARGGERGRVHARPRAARSPGHDAGRELRGGVFTRGGVVRLRHERDARGTEDVFSRGDARRHAHVRARGARHRPQGSRASKHARDDARPVHDRRRPGREREVRVRGGVPRRRKKLRV
mmetsp:Transcript_2715/g.8726  ORF Transcript_2715/g.8726 Transcript_2715/m.8726 type:complete len:314 (+) Transcript_2715:725-1666(+)